MASQWIAQSNLPGGVLRGTTVLLTGGGGGIGLETARALLWLEAAVVIVEINASKANSAMDMLRREYPLGDCSVMIGDVGNQDFVRSLQERFPDVDVVLNNAAVTPLGPVVDVPIQEWDQSYHVNVRGPVLLAKTYLPGMIQRGKGAFICVSSTGAQFMGPYESMKAAQVHLANTLEAEVEGSGVSVFSIGPGFVPTETALGALPIIAKWMSIEVTALQEILQPQMISIEAAGTSFAAAVVLADRYHGQEIGGIQALIDAGIPVNIPGSSEVYIGEFDWASLSIILFRMLSTLEKESASWNDRSLFERQWLLRTFKKKAGLPVSKWLEVLQQLCQVVENKDTHSLQMIFAPADQMTRYYEYLHDMGAAYMKNDPHREEYLSIVEGWAADARELARLLKPDQ